MLFPADVSSFLDLVCVGERPKFYPTARNLSCNYSATVYALAALSSAANLSFSSFLVISRCCSNVA